MIYQVRCQKKNRTLIIQIKQTSENMNRIDIRQIYVD